MADTLSMALEELLHKARMDHDLDFLKDGLRVMMQELMDAEVTQHLGVEKYHAALSARDSGMGTGDRQWDTRVGTIDLHVPRVRDGSFFPTLLEPRKRAEKALLGSCRRRTCRACPRGGSTTWFKHSAWTA